MGLGQPFDFAGKVAVITGGGGVLCLRAGGNLIVDDHAEVLVLGGDANDTPSHISVPPVRAPGGAGSGGSVLAQCGGIPQVLGKINVSGGGGGEYIDRQLLFVSSRGGDGGAGHPRSSPGGRVPGRGIPARGRRRGCPRCPRSAAARGRRR